MATKKSAAAVEMARKRADSLSPERRQEIARDAATARWGKKGAKKAAEKKPGATATKKRS